MEEIEKEITLKELIQSVRKIWEYLLTKWMLIVIGGVVGVILGLSVSFVYSPKYKASLSILVDDGNSVGGLIGLASSFGIAGGEQSLFSIPNIIQIFNSQTLVEEALLQPVKEKGYDNRTYADLYIKEYKLDKGWEDEPILKEIQFKIGEDRTGFGREKDSILGEVYKDIVEKRLSVSQPDKKNSFIHVGINTRNEVFSKNFAEDLAKVITRYYSVFKTKKAKSSVDVLQHQVDSVRHSLFLSIGGAASSLDQVFGLNPAMSVQKINSVKEQAQVQMNIAVLQELVKQLEIAKIDLLNNTPVIHVVDSSRYPLEKKEIGILLGIAGGGFMGCFFISAYLILKRKLNEE